MTDINTKDARDSTHSLPEKIKVTISCEDGGPLGGQNQTAQVEYLTSAAPVLLIQRDGRSITTFYRDANAICDMLQELAECEHRKACRQQKTMECEREDEYRQKVTISREDGSPIFSRDQTAHVEYLTEAAPILLIRRGGGSIETLSGGASWVCDMLRELLERDREIERELMEYQCGAERHQKE